MLVKPKIKILVLMIIIDDHPFRFPSDNLIPFIHALGIKNQKN